MSGPGTDAIYRSEDTYSGDGANVCFVNIGSECGVIWFNVIITCISGNVYKCVV